MLVIGCPLPHGGTAGKYFCWGAGSRFCLVCLCRPLGGIGCLRPVTHRAAQSTQRGSQKVVHGLFERDMSGRVPCFPKSKPGNEPSLQPCLVMSGFFSAGRGEGAPTTPTEGKLDRHVMLVWQVVHHARKFSALGRNLRRSRRASELKAWSHCCSFAWWALEAWAGWRHGVGKSCNCRCKHCFVRRFPGSAACTMQ